MSRGHNGAVVLVVKSGTAEVHNTYCSTLNGPLLSFLKDSNICNKYCVELL